MNEYSLSKNHIFNKLLRFVTLPALIIGVFTMIFYSVPSKIWMLNLTTGLIFIVISYFSNNYTSISRSQNPFLIVIISIILILSTFFFKGINEVHRWVDLKGIQLNIGIILSPILLIQISKIKNSISCFTIFIVIIFLFLLQPDASLVTAFSVSAIILLFVKIKNKFFFFLLIGFTISSVIYSWYNLDNLEPVNYVEGIIKLTFQISPILSIFSILSLFLLVYPFYKIGFRKNSLATSLGLFYTTLIISSFFGNFPVIIIGYGISPIIGYFFGQNWLIQTNKKLIG